MKRVVLLLLLAPILVARADEVDDMKAAGAPDDIIAIMRKMKAGTPPSADDLNKIRAWQKGLAGRVNSGGAQAGTQFGPHVQDSPQGIPVRLEFHTSVHAQGQDWSEQVDTDGVADAIMYPSINGNGDYRRAILDPNQKTSSFRFEPVMKNNQLVRSGSGHYSYKHVGGCTETVSASYAWTTFATALKTTGRDDHLLGLGGGYGGTLNGTRSGCGDPETWHEHPAPSDIQYPFIAETAANSHPLPANAPTPPSQFTMSYSAMVAAVTSGKTTTVTGSEPYNLTLETGTRISGSSTLSITLHPTEMKLVIEPTNAPTYKDWQPMPDAKDGGHQDLFGDPAPLSVHVVLAKTATPYSVTRPDATTPGKIELALKDVSTHPGITMNYPAKGKGDTKPDLFFLPQARQPAGIHVIDDKHAETTSPVVETTVLVAARDTGAYGSISAEIKTLSMTSTNPVDNQPNLMLPLDDNGNHIADAWEVQEGIKGKNLPPTWDDEDEPKDLPLNRGDGMTLFDQYRGMLLSDGAAEHYHRISPKQRSLFMFAAGPDRALYRDGAATYAAATGFAVYQLHFPARLALSGDAGENAFVPRWTNFNTTPFTQAKVYAVWIEDTDKPWDKQKMDAWQKQHPLVFGRREDSGAVPAGNTIGTLDDDGAYLSERMSPKTTQRINISRQTLTLWLTDNWAWLFKNVPKLRTAAVKLGRDPDALGRSLMVGKAVPTLVDEAIRFATIHELGHATGGHHHPNESKDGDPNCPMFYWQAADLPDLTNFVRFLAGDWHPGTTAPNNQKWRFCEAQDAPMLTVKP